MCKAVNHIKLCSCGEVTYGQNQSWRLVRGATYFRVVGDFLPPSTDPLPFKLSRYVEHKIEDDLNRCDVFDFDYIPQEKDTLTIFLNRSTYHFAVFGGEFRSCPKDYFGYDGTLSNEGKLKLTDRF